jgi:2-polyprenyl-3-methyl-5-hydroxy-6-metoxy-1,4-benzoquinol methylase
VYSRDGSHSPADTYVAAATTGLLVDASCASGLFTQLFAASGHFSAVVALDYSEAMLRQAGAFLAADKAVGASK